MSVDDLREQIDSDAFAMHTYIAGDAKHGERAKEEMIAEMFITC